MGTSGHGMLEYCFPIKIRRCKAFPSCRGRFLPVLGIVLFFLARPLSAQYSAEASITPTQVKTGGELLVTYTFKILGGSPTLWRIRIPWPGNVYVKSVERNTQSMWLINRPASPPQSSVVSWIFEPVQQYLELRSFAGDLKSPDLVKVVFAIQAPDSLSTKSFDGLAGSPELLNRCISKGTEIKIVAAQ